MNRMKYAGALAVAMVVMTAGNALAQSPQPCAMMKDHQMGDMQQQGTSGMGMGRMKQDKQMGGMQDCKMMQDCPMMQDVKDQQQLMLEMKKHMQMMDKMMEMMMQRQQGMGMTPSGGASTQQEHHPAQNR